MNDAAAARLRSGAECLGTWLSIGAPMISELAVECGFDWLLFDLEHGRASEDDILPNLQAVRGSQAAAIVRVGAPASDLILRVLDWGADGIMVPHVANRAEAEHCVKAVRYPPDGHRGFSSSARAYGYGLRAPDLSKPLPEPFLTMQIETIEGVENVREIAGVNGVDALFVGPSDLKFNLARNGGKYPAYTQCLDRIAKAAKEAGIPWGILVREPSKLEILRSMGATLLAVDSDLGILREGYRAILQENSGPAEQ